MVVLSKQQTLSNIHRTLVNADQDSNKFKFSHIEINISSALNKSVSDSLIRDIENQLVQYNKINSYTFTTERCSDTKIKLLLDDQYLDDICHQIHTLMNLLYLPFANHYGSTGKTAFSSKIRLRLAFKSKLNKSDMYKVLIIDNYNNTFQIL